ncbi:MAG: tyrosine--tRNA ligase, partial [Alphaproteobacteria bacterium]|nr:tyrosine--tRNA ligase [Alphaproteobacteria bacterium]
LQFRILRQIPLHKILLARVSSQPKPPRPILPQVNRASGAKMGKTAAGAVWLDSGMLSPYDYWQFWRNTEDADVGRFLRFFTTLPMDEIKKLESMEGAGINEAKKILATTITALCHGQAAADEAAETARKVFEGGGVGDALPIVEVPQAELTEGIAAYALLHKAGLAESGGEARKLVRGGGAKLNDEKISDENHKITTADLSPEGHIKLSAGKKRHVLVKAA